MTIDLLCFGNHFWKSRPQEIYNINNIFFQRVVELYGVLMQYLLNVIDVTRAGVCRRQQHLIPQH